MAILSAADESALSRRAKMDGLNRSLARNWWALGLRGGLAVLLGLAALVMPLVTLGSVVLVFGIYLLVDGALALVAGARAAAQHERWGWLIAEGVANLLAGVVALTMPGLTVVVLVTVLGAWSVVTGGLMLGAAFRLHLDHGRWLLVLGGALSLVWGVLLFTMPIAGALVLTWWLGAYALMFGVLLVILALRLRERMVHHRGLGSSAII
jgi:uncharacterized membrane protein HdeD (DUF308 family)